MAGTVKEVAAAVATAAEATAVAVKAEWAVAAAEEAWVGMALVVETMEKVANLGLGPAGSMASLPSSEYLRG